MNGSDALHRQAIALRAQADALDALAEELDGDRLAAGPGLVEESSAAEESWASRIHTVHPDTRLGLSELSEALGVSERTVRRYIAGRGEDPPLEAAKGPTGLTVRAGDLVAWIAEVEDANRWREAS